MAKKKVKSRKRNTEIHDRKPLSERAWNAMLKNYYKQFDNKSDMCYND